MLFLEDLSPGQSFSSPAMAVLPDDTAQFGDGGGRVPELHVACMTMRLLVESDFRPAGGILGAGVEGLHWPHPVQPGETLHLRTDIMEVRRSKSRPDRGTAKVRTTTLNDADQPVQVMVSTVIVSARDAAAQ